MTLPMRKCGELPSEPGNRAEELGKTAGGKLRHRDRKESGEGEELHRLPPQVPKDLPSSADPATRSLGM